MPWSTGRSDRDRAKPRNWATVRRAVLERDNYQCQIRDKHCTSTASHADHTDQAAGPWDTRLEVLRAACPSCHMARTARQAHAARPQLKRQPAKHPGLM